jgi:hypothetical protein
MSKVYQAINAVQAELAATGISKDRRNQQQGYNFRGIDDVYNALAPMLAKHHLCILPRILSRECTERQTQKGGALFYVVVEAEFDLIASEDGTKHTIRTYGEAMDSADKATNKAMSAAYKYAAMQAFAIPTEGDNDADAVTHDVAPRQPAKSKPTAVPDMRKAPAETSFDQAEAEDMAANYVADFLGWIAGQTSEAEIRRVWKEEAPHRKAAGVIELQVAEMFTAMKKRFDALAASPSLLMAGE